MEGEEDGAGPAPARLCGDPTLGEQSSHRRHPRRDTEARLRLPPRAGLSGPPCPAGFRSALWMSGKLHKSWT